MPAETAPLSAEADQANFEEMVDECVEEMWIDEVVDEFEEQERNMNTH